MPSGRDGRADLCARHHSLLALDAEADQRGDVATELDRLVLGQVAEVFDLDLACGVLVYDQRVDDADGVVSLKRSSLR